MNLKFWKSDKITPTTYNTRVAFVINGRTFLEFVNPLEMPFDRAMNYLLISTEMDMRVDRKVLLEFTAAMKNVLTGDRVGSEKFIEAYTLNKNLTERLNFALDTELIYKNCGVWFFEDNENPAKYSPERAADNIAFWKQHEDITAFFLSEPIRRLCPLLNDYNGNLKAYSQLENQIKTEHQKHRLSLLSAKPN